MVWNQLFPKWSRGTWLIKPKFDLISRSGSLNHTDWPTSHFTMLELPCNFTLVSCRGRLTTHYNVGNLATLWGAMISRPFVLKLSGGPFSLVFNFPAWSLCDVSNRQNAGTIITISGAKIVFLSLWREERSYKSFHPLSLVWWYNPGLHPRQHAASAADGGKKKRKN